MNSLYNLALRQSASVNSDLSILASSNPATSSALQEKISSSLAALSRTVDDYEGLASKELVPAKREKALLRVAKFREEEMNARRELIRLKSGRAGQASTTSTSTSTQYGQASTSSANTSNTDSGLHARPAQSPSAAYGQNGFGASAHDPSRSNTPNYGAGSSMPYGQSPYGQSYGGGPSAHAVPMHNDPLASYRAAAQAQYQANGGSSRGREDMALREHSFIGNAEAQIDALIAQGRQTWGNLTEQRDVLKGTQKRLRDAALTMGLSRDVISYIERRSTQDNIIFAVGALFTLVAFYFILKWFG
ncbi:V-snare-domain-containing protein [Ceraceosorus guamensis]|uniref:Protein transport protein BOS1 n=1 Tax=Ceraceosorus guamensis TaxID=1522189 RepID=A0A316W6A5_9BASI|nr:V-snare-domain-containing protein [Ceraceosorus guamensis]PWN43195.1 V-snare-domain-containing protein [Ceraceosorus guamensis]